MIDKAYILSIVFSLNLYSTEKYAGFWEKEIVNYHFFLLHYLYNIGKNYRLFCCDLSNNNYFSNNT